jgi:hypothetical protein
MIVIFIPSCEHACTLISRKKENDAHKPGATAGGAPRYAAGVATSTGTRSAAGTTVGPRSAPTKEQPVETSTKFSSDDLKKNFFLNYCSHTPYIHTHERSRSKVPAPGKTSIA